MRNIKNYSLLTHFSIDNSKLIIVRILDNSAWLEFSDLVLLLQQSPETVKKQITNLFDEKVANEKTVKIIQNDKEFYNLDIIEKLDGNTLEKNRFIFYSLLSICFQDVCALLKNYEILKELPPIIEGNKQLPVNHPFFISFYHSLKLTLLVLIRKLTDIENKKQTVSLIIALKKFKEMAEKSPELLTREFYIQRYKKPWDDAVGHTIMTQMGNQNFDEIIGVDKDTLSREMIDKDIQALKASPIGLIRKLTSARGVHLSQEIFTQKPTYKQLEIAVGTIKKIAIKYFKLMQLPFSESQYQLPSNWDDIFKTPWISNQLSQKVVIQKLKQNLPKFQKEFGINQLYLYGSFARGDQNAQSDIDILIDLGANVKKTFIVDHLKYELHNIFHRKIDLVSQDLMDPLIKYAIQKELIPIG